MEYESNRMYQAMAEEVRTFGKLFAKYAYSGTLDDLSRHIDGRCTAPRIVEMRKKLESFSPEQIETLKLFIKEAVTTCMFNTMIMINESDEIKLLTDSGCGEKELREISDGLEGDLWGWLEWFGGQE